MTKYSRELIKSAPSAIDLADSYQRAESLYLHPYPTYGVDRVLLENRDAFLENYSNYYPGRSQRMQPPEGIRELFLERTKDAPKDSDRGTYRIGGVNEDKLRWLRDQWLENYLIPRTLDLDSDAELDAWKIIIQKFDITNDNIGVRSNASNDTPRLLIEDTHLVKGLWGSAAVDFIVPPGVALTGDYGHCDVLNTNATSIDFSHLPKISADILAILLDQGYIRRGPKSMAKALAQCAVAS